MIQNLTNFLNKNDFKIVPMNKTKLTTALEDMQSYYQTRFTKLFQKDFLIKMV